MGAPVDGGAERTTFWLGVAVLVLDEPADGVPVELADGVPAEHAATDRLAAQAAKASAAERYLFIGFLQSVHTSQVPTLNARPASQGRFAASPASLRRELDRAHVLGPESRHAHPGTGEMGQRGDVALVSVPAELDNRPGRMRSSLAFRL
jgi:hypothetical protein